MKKINLHVMQIRNGNGFTISFNTSMMEIIDPFWPLIHIKIFSSYHCTSSSCIHVTLRYIYIYRIHSNHIIFLYLKCSINRIFFKDKNTIIISYNLNTIVILYFIFPLHIILLIIIFVICINENIFGNKIKNYSKIYYM